MSSEVKPVLFHYFLSPYARRVSWYLTLRGIQHKQCLQPLIMPRPDLETLGVQYRRIPVLSIGKDVYCDTRLIIKKLEEQFPDGRLGATDGEGQALENLLETWSTDGGLFLNAVLLMPLDLPSLRDPAFLKDRSTFLTGPKWKMEDMPSLRGEAMVQVKRAFDFLESTLLADGRDWLRKTEKPTLADIHAIWPLDWVLDMGSLEDSIVTEASHPKVFAWIARFRQALSHAKGRLEEMLVSGSEVLDGLQHESFAQSDAEFDDSDPLGLEKGEEVLVWPTDSGSTHQDAGTLIGLNSKEIVLQRKTADNRFDIRIHFPRLNFKVVSAAHVQQTKL
ncbi:Glutathione S-transferase, N-terminal [Trichophyton rubrum]|nr:Glutathione S-transferase, N-terminal [Trichophyton rubrum]